MTRDDSIKWAERLQLPQIVKDIVGGTPLPKDLDVSFGFPEEFVLLSEAEQVSHGWGGLVPLWDTGNFDEVVAYCPGRGGYVRFYVEEPLDLATVALWNWQQVLLPDFCALYELEVEDQQFREYARLFEFRYAEEIMAGYATEDLSTFEKSNAWRAKMLRRMGEDRRPTRA